ncbi:MAG: agmatinase [Candidatus Auribacter fodinae]|jgi:agmatinase|uniref:Agmatinase n=1 Tax=Candidatus Auribacter fodinae TaxID=2093366 RepID=A0A3A4RD76_9BACT|nr:MAG: agmatinase [Candidatus Auribacter fodinae]
MRVPNTPVFLDLPPELCDRDTARVVVVPVPFEGSTSYGKGTIYGPHAIINASAQVELWDEMSECEPCEMGIATDDQITCGDGWTTMSAELSAKAVNLAKDKKFPFFLGGEHSISAPIVQGLSEVYKNLTVLHCDAHADLREEYQGLKWSHASVMKRIWEMGIPFASVGIRSLSAEEHDLICEHKLNVFFAHKRHDDPDWIDKVISKLGSHVYVTFDIDAVDISEVRATGTPEPGGLYWREIMMLFSKLHDSGKKVVGADLVEVAPCRHDHASTFYAARLAYKLISYLA